MEETALPFDLPIVAGRRWFRAIDTVLPAPLTVAAEGAEVLITTPAYVASPRSAVVLVSKAAP